MPLRSLLRRRGIAPLHPKEEPDPAETLTFTASVEVQAAKADKPPRVSIVAYTGGLMKVSQGTVLIALDGLSLPASFPLLVDHDQSLAGIAGQGSAQVVDGSLYVEGNLAPSSEAAQSLIALSKEGVSLQASVGCDIRKASRVEAGDTVTANGKTIKAETAFNLISNAALREVSIVALGADGQTSVRIAASKLPSKEPIMPKTLDPAVVQERERLSLIEGMLMPPEGGWGSIEPQVAALRASAFKEEIALSDLPQKIRTLTELRATRDDRPRPVGPGIVSHGEAKGNNVLEASLALHVGVSNPEKVYGEQTVEASRRLGVHSLFDFCREALKATTGQTYGVNSKDALIKASFGSHDIATMLSNVANKTLLEAYNAFPSAARVIAKRLTAENFKDHTGIRLTGDATLLKLGGDGEIKHGTLSNQSYTYSIETYGRMFGIDRKSIINDDLGGLSDIPRLLGRGSAIAIDEALWALVIANTGNFFHADNNNLLSGGSSALSATSLGTAVQKFLEAVDSKGKPVAAVPRWLVVPPALKVTADELYTARTLNVGGGSTSTDNKLAAENVMYGKYEPLVAPWIGSAGLSGGSNTAWYLFGDPRDIAAFGLAFLGDVTNPIIEQEAAPFNTLGIQLRGYIDFGVCQIDKIGGVKAAGA